MLICKYSLRNYGKNDGRNCDKICLGNKLASITPKVQIIIISWLSDIFFTEGEEFTPLLRARNLSYLGHRSEKKWKNRIMLWWCYAEWFLDSIFSTMEYCNWSWGEQTSPLISVEKINQNTVWKNHIGIGKNRYMTTNHINLTSAIDKAKNR